MSSLQQFVGGFISASETAGGGSEVAVSVVDANAEGISSTGADKRFSRRIKIVFNCNSVG